MATVRCIVCLFLTLSFLKERVSCGLLRIGGNRRGVSFAGMRRFGVGFPKAQVSAEARLSRFVTLSLAELEAEAKALRRQLRRCCCLVLALGSECC